MVRAAAMRGLDCTEPLVGRKQLKMKLILACLEEQAMQDAFIAQALTAANTANYLENQQKIYDLFLPWYGNGVPLHKRLIEAWKKRFGDAD